MKKLIIVMGLAALFGGCGDDKVSASEAKEICNKSCDKIDMCFMQPAATQQCRTGCNSIMGDSGDDCTNARQIADKIEECNGKSCMEFQTCITTVPDCQGGNAGGSGGGSGGSGGMSGGTGGTSGGASCDACTKADSCCSKVTAMGGMMVQCSYAAACNATSGAQRDQVIAGCNQLTTAWATQFPSISECQ